MERVRTDGANENPTARRLADAIWERMKHPPDWRRGQLSTESSLGRALFAVVDTMADEIERLERRLDNLSERLSMVDRQTESEESYVGPVPD